MYGHSNDFPSLFRIRNQHHRDHSIQDPNAPLFDHSSSIPVPRPTTAPVASRGTIPSKREAATSYHLGSKQVDRSVDSIETTSAAMRQPERGVWCTWTRLAKASLSDSYGIGVSEGLSTRGTFVSAIRPNSSADRSGQLHLYDRILMVSQHAVFPLCSCCENLILDETTFHNHPCSCYRSVDDDT